jgi:processing peptidase subunit alpha
MKLSSLPITESVPDFIPPNVPSQELKAPETHITKLDNGIRVVSQETYGQMCTIGVLTDVGSRHEPTSGIIHLLETMAFGSTKRYDSLQIAQRLQDWGATRFVSHSREQTLHCIDILRPNVKEGMQLLSQVVLEPLITEVPDDFMQALAVLEFQAQEQLPELVLGEALQVAAYGPEQQLGKLHFATLDTIPQLTPDLVQDFYLKSIRNNPEGMVIAAAGFGHDELVDLANKFFGDMKQQEAPATVPTMYRGG